ncbi:glutamate ABC transporter substrate-binding protein [Streptomyces pacificus]|uniref:Transporter substrate-binding domain-containing protein n=1 Tax=Streptomyces pacificus TaxID=2705029 RepID=A0A6A0B225_9ACTN|nr:glutamate ABC transporter substrate-binding protein [Streptomyces pacificus]GFH39339.1 transporter substrate-binding domain-containing protein [Streptomyces pacificus]
MKFRKASAAAAAAAALALTVTACGGDGSTDDSAGDGSGTGKITVGIKFDQPGIGLKEPDGSFSGMDVEVAKYVAGELGYDEKSITFKETKSADRETALQNGDVDFIIASYSINDERKQKVDFAGPYFLAHQDLLVRADDTSISEATDLNTKNLCSVTGSTSAQNVKNDFAKDAGLVNRGGYSECLGALQNKVVDALTTDDSILAGYAAQDQYKGKFKLAGLNLSNENYGIGVKKGSDLTAKINEALEKMVSDGSWQKVMDETFGPAGYEFEPAPKIGELK